MNLPHYFLADQPPDAVITATMVTEACQALKRNREQYLASRSTESLINFLGGIAQEWLQPSHHFRKMVLQAPSSETGFSTETLQKGLDGFFRQLTAPNLHQLVEQDLGHVECLDRFVTKDGAQSSGRSGMAIGPELIAHITAGNLPVPALNSMVLGLLTRSAQFLKCASGTS